jgi:hypothetical protein
MEHKYQYIVNTKMEYFDEPLFWYKWNYDGGHTEFGGMFTETQFRAKQIAGETESAMTNIRKEQHKENSFEELTGVQREWKEMMDKFKNVNK